MATATKLKVKKMLSFVGNGNKTKMNENWQSFTGNGNKTAISKNWQSFPGNGNKTKINENQLSFPGNGNKTKMNENQLSFNGNETAKNEIGQCCQKIWTKKRWFWKKLRATRKNFSPFGRNPDLDSACWTIFGRLFRWKIVFLRKTKSADFCALRRGTLKSAAGPQKAPVFARKRRIWQHWATLSFKSLDFWSD